MAPATPLTTSWGVIPPEVFDHVRHEVFEYALGYAIGDFREVVQYRDGRLVFREQYADVRVNDPIPDDTFDPVKWVAAQPKP